MINYFFVYDEIDLKKFSKVYQYVNLIVRSNFFIEVFTESPYLAKYLNINIIFLLFSNS